MGLLIYEAAKFPKDFDIMDTSLVCHYTPKRAQDFYHWHQSVLQDRIHYLLNFCSQASGIAYERLYSFPDGSLPLWRWFLQVVETVPLTPEEKEKMFQKLAPQMKGHPPQVISDVISDMIPDWVLSKKSEEILWDIAMYVGDGFTRLSPKLHWELFRDHKADVSYNRAVVRGFTPPGIVPGRTAWAEPLGLVRVQALHFVKGTGSEYGLQDIIMQRMSGV
jgi:hypothetical protein